MPAGWRSATSSPTVTLLLRHGQTPYSLDRRFAGQVDIGLTETGVAQAAAAARRLGKEWRAGEAGGGIDAIVSSPLLRARLTAQAVGDACGARLAADEGFAETDFGAWDGLSFAEASETYPAEMKDWLASAEVAPPGGESFAAVRVRVLDALSRVLAAHSAQTVVVVSHVTPIKILLATALEAPLSSLHRMFLDTACLNRIDWYPDGPAVVRSLNDTAHLS